MLLVLVVASIAFRSGENLAGDSKPGATGDGGPAAQARVNQPFDVAFDSAGHLYFSDTGNHRIRRVDAKTGTISTVAGSGKKGYGGEGGPATEALLDEPYGICLDDRGNLYFADRLNRRVRRVDAATGRIGTVAGDGSNASSGDGGPAAKAGLVEPNGVALDGKGWLYIADVAAHRIRVVDLASGTISTFAGDGRGRHAGDGGPAASASIHGARAVEVGPDGTVWILERQGNTLRAVDPRTGIITTRAGTGKVGFTGDGGAAKEATFNGPKELCLDRAGNVFVVDTENHAIRRIDAASGRITTVAGDGRRPVKGEDDPGTTDRLDRPHGVAVAADGSIVVGDTGNHRVRKARPPSSN
jgi:sugar lactone lactonase YvrE